MQRHDLGALFWPRRDLFLREPSDERKTVVGEVHKPIQSDGWEEQVAIQDHGRSNAADDGVEPARASEITQDFEPALEQPGCQYVWKNMQHERDGPRGMNLCAGNGASFNAPPHHESRSSVRVAVSWKPSDERHR